MENDEKVRKNEGTPMKNEGKVMEKKEKVRKPCPRPKKNKIPKTRKKNPQKIPHPISSAIPLAALHDWNVWIFADLDVRAIVWLHFL